jgi:hypothetical protein
MNGLLCVCGHNLGEHYEMADGKETKERKVNGKRQLKNRCIKAHSVTYGDKGNTKGNFEAISRSRDIEAFREGLDQHVIELLEVNEAFMHASTFRAQSGIACAIFEDWLHDTFLPDLAARRERYSYDSPAFLILDNCTAHCAPRITDMCERNGMILLYLPPRSLHFLHCLDLSICGLT